ncbi:hypothetical protein ABFB09_07535 [Dehalogenimonas sp. THU2]|uniref:hypothetical protein n=1 Tax=Dehalogenimonas sp. THU2 TaxID=3151121 RepID=UPI00321891B6
MKGGYMEERRNNLQTWIAIAIGVAIIIGAVGSYARWWDLGYGIGSYSLAHWSGWISAVLISVTVPLFVILKRRSGIPYLVLLTSHVFINLVAFGLLTLHWAHHLGREFSPDWGTGLTMFLVISGMVLTGVIQRFRLVPKSQGNMRFIHRGLSLSLIIILPIHVLQNTGMI